MEKEHQPDSMATVNIKPDYPPSEVYSTNEPPPAYRQRLSNSVQIARIVAVTVILSSFILGSFILASSWVSSQAGCQQLDQLDAMLDKELALEGRRYDEIGGLPEELPISNAHALHQEPTTTSTSSTEMPKVVQPLSGVQYKDDAHVAESNKDEDRLQKLDEDDDDDADGSDSEENELDSRNNGVPFKLPVEFDLDDIAGAFLANNDMKGRMNCVVERRRSDPIERQFPFNLLQAITGKITGTPVNSERVAIICHAGDEQRTIIPEPASQVFAFPLNGPPQMQMEHRSAPPAGLQPPASRAPFHTMVKMKGPIRPAPAAPLMQQRYSPVTNWNDDPFSKDVFEPSPMFAKKKPPPRPPPPKLQPKVPEKPTHFLRKPTVLSTILSRKPKPNANSNKIVNTSPEIIMETKIANLFPKCEPRPSNIQTGSLIDFSTPPSSPTFTTRSSSDGLSIDSFGSDATSSTNNHHAMNGNASQAESGFEDDFDLILSKKINKDDTIEDFANFDPFSPPRTVIKKPTIQRSPDFLDPLHNGKSVVSKVLTHNKPTIIRANKPARPKPPDNSALLTSSLSNPSSTVSMTINTAKPIEKASLATDYYSIYDTKSAVYDSSYSQWDSNKSDTSTIYGSNFISNTMSSGIYESNYASNTQSSTMYSSNLSSGLHSKGGYESSYTSVFDKDYPQCEFERDSSPPMPSIPPPPPPVLDDLDLPLPEPSEWPEDESDEDEPYAVALYDFNSDLSEDLSFTANTRITLLKRLNDEWLHGRLKNGVEGMFPANYVDIKVPLPGDEFQTEPKKMIGRARALYDLVPSQPGDLPLRAGAEITIFDKISDEWYSGMCDGVKGNFPANYVVLL